MVLTIRQDSLLAALSGRARAVVEYADGAGSSHTTAEFPLAGLEKVREAFIAACAKRGGWLDRAQGNRTILATDGTPLELTMNSM